MLDQSVIEKILIKAKNHQSVYDNERAKEKKYADQLSSLIQLFAEHAQNASIEGFSPWIYLDSPGAYLTIGYGHLIYQRPEKITPPLEIQRLKLDSSALKDIHSPWDVSSGLKFTPDMILDMYNNKGICLGLLDCLSTDFEMGTLYLDGKTPKVKRTDPIPKKDKDNLIVSYYSQMVVMSILLNMRAKSRGTVWSNKFSYEKFAIFSTSEGTFQPPVITKSTAHTIFLRDVSKKILELTAPIDLKTPTFPNFQTYPVNVQLALLDLAYNTGVGTLVNNKNFYALVVSEDWKALGEMSVYPKRSDPAFAKRNAIVRNWFLSAAPQKKLQEASK